MAKLSKTYEAGLDVGSTTVKMVIVDEDRNIVFDCYERHNTQFYESIISFLSDASSQLGNPDIRIQLTGSAGMGVSEKTGIPFVQEVIATDRFIRKYHPEVKTLVDIGGEDSKMIFFNENKVPDIRMNGNCAGGTGAFIDQIATLLNISPRELNDLAKKHTSIYPIASRCGVFAKTDVQNLLSRKIPKADIAASIFHAVAIQCMNTLARGFSIEPKIMLCGGPFTFLPELIKIFLKVVHLDESYLSMPEKPELLPALGASIIDKTESDEISMEDLIIKLEKAQHTTVEVNDRLSPLFNSESEFEDWKKQHASIEIKRVALKDYQEKECYLGIDSGSTTTKVVVSGTKDEVLFDWYCHNVGNPILTVNKGLEIFRKALEDQNPSLEIKKTTVTGYGEDLIKAAFGIDQGVVETIAHFTAAKYISPDVSFVLDIGGQDMKAIFVEDGIINRIELNEACSSGCGSFIEMFSNSLNYDVSDFAKIACTAKAPCDLGTRCTVFMNSKVKQSLRENATIAEISAGLSYSVIKNCLFKVLKLHNMADLGDNIVLQGGTFKNPSIVRALELLTERKVNYSNIPELMGAYGASLISRQAYEANKEETTSFVGLANLEQVNNFKTRQVFCKGCENNCTITRFTFTNKKTFFSGNKCEKFFISKGEKIDAGFNLFEYKYNLLFQEDPAPPLKPKFTIGVPKILSLYENFPFWNRLFNACGIKVVLSASSTMALNEKGMGMVMSDSICFPAKLAHGHIVDLAEKKVDRIFYPTVIYEKSEFEDSVNSFNCPIVGSYGEVIESSTNPAKKYGIPFDKPAITFSDPVLLKQCIYDYLKQFGISKRTVHRAVESAYLAQDKFKAKIRAKAILLINKARKENRLLVVLAGRPYHTDPLINQKTPEILSGLGADVIMEDAVPLEEINGTNEIHVLTQWSYTNRIFKAAQWASEQPDNVQFIQLNSFGCGPDALVTDECKSILKTGSKNYTLIKVDEISSTGSVKLRLRSMIESLKLKKRGLKPKQVPRENTPRFELKDKKRTILAPYFADKYSPLIPALFYSTGYNVVNLPKPDRESVELGLKFANNDICYPATIIIGDIIKALQKGNYDHNEIAIGITQTGGQCRASNYLALIKKAMVSAGFGNVPVISVTTSDGLNDQPGFEIDWLKMAKILFYGTIYTDVLAKMYYSIAVREKEKGTCDRLHESYLKKAEVPIQNKDYEGLLNLIREGVNDFNNVPIHDKEYPKIGIVGEIFVKYNAFGHQKIVDWLLDNQIEPVVPPLLDFFIQDLVNARVNRSSHMMKRKLSDVFINLFEFSINKHLNKINKIQSQFKFHSPFHNIKDIAQKAGKILNLVNQFGEGWLIAAEIASFASEGVNNVVSLQPFGCIANHVISKGVETKIKTIYPEMNLLFLDFDSGTSEVNVLNRLYFMMKNVLDKGFVA